MLYVRRSALLGLLLITSQAALLPGVVWASEFSESACLRCVERLSADCVYCIFNATNITTTFVGNNSSSSSSSSSNITAIISKQQPEPVCDCIESDKGTISDQCYNASEIYSDEWDCKFGPETEEVSAAVVIVVLVLCCCGCCCGIGWGIFFCIKRVNENRPPPLGGPNVFPDNNMTGTTTTTVAGFPTPPAYDSSAPAPFPTTTTNSSFVPPATNPSYLSERNRNNNTNLQDEPEIPVQHSIADQMMKDLQS